MSDRLDPSNVVDRLTERFGTQARLAEAAGCTQSTISERRKRRSLTHRQMRRILEKAPDMGVPVTPDDFFTDIVAEISTPSDAAA
jgi:transcriptional regulator with XRE-family HTH domain